MDLAARIAEAEAAYHNLMTGRHAVKVTIEGQETEFNRVSAPALKAYIAGLKAELAGLMARGGGAIGWVF